MSAIKVGICAQAEKGALGPPRASLESRQLHPRDRGTKQRIDRHKDGSIKARGHVLDDVPAGYWEWFRKGGTKMRSGYFAKGKQVGEWTTYDAKGKWSSKSRR